MAASCRSLGTQLHINSRKYEHARAPPPTHTHTQTENEPRKDAVCPLSPLTAEICPIRSGPPTLSRIEQADQEPFLLYLLCQWHVTFRLEATWGGVGMRMSGECTRPRRQTFQHHRKALATHLGTLHPHHQSTLHTPNSLPRQPRGRGTTKK